ncbi:MAG: anhydro-N-acetylmuramic acid kinase [Burkholderiales bacterium]
MPDRQLFVGVMSGTSADGINVALVSLEQGQPRQIAARYVAYSDALRSRILALNSAQPDELHEASTLAIELSQEYGKAIASLLREAGLGRQDVRAVGCHGQTVRHRPDAGYTVQLVNGSLLAEITGVVVVCDFRSRDIAAGGQGAPLVPAFHQAVFASPGHHRVIVNIGGIANVTNLPASGPASGFDTGPGNALLDAWAASRLGRTQDEGGKWASSGRVIDSLLSRLNAHPFFRKKPPKSTGRDEFNLAWVERNLDIHAVPQDVQATLLALTAQSIAVAIRAYCEGADEIYLCGGGVHNNALMAALRREFGPIPLQLTDALGVAADWVEACAFGWLAYKTLRNEPANLPEVTGAKGPRILGAIYPA